VTFITLRSSLNGHLGPKFSKHAVVWFGGKRERTPFSHFSHEQNAFIISFRY